MSTAPNPNDDDDLYEIIDGKRVILTKNIFASWIATELFLLLARDAKTQDLGWWIRAALFHLPRPTNRDRRPDLAFVSYQRWPKKKPISRDDDAWDVVPDLAVEVVSPTDVAEKLREKIPEYFRAGVSLVWVIYPLGSEVHVYESPTSVRILGATSELDGGNVLPGFRLALTELFRESQANGAIP
jgi:Uma2 family endonuclease